MMGPDMQTRDTEESGRSSVTSVLRDTGPAGLPVVILLSTILLLWVADPKVSFSEPNLNILLYSIFSLLMPLSVTFLIARSFLKTGEPGLVLLGCGVVVWGTSGVASLMLPKVDADTTFTIYNLCLLLSALFHFTGASASIQTHKRIQPTGQWLFGAYVGALSCVGLIVYSAYEDLIPAFFIPGQGPTLLRQLVLASAFILFVISAAMLKVFSRHSVFKNWYALALLLIATGILGFLLQSSTLDSILTWSSRSALFLSGAYMLIAAIASVRETKVWEVSLEGALAESRKHYNDLLDLIADGILVQELPQYTAHGKFVRANPAICAMLGYTQEEIYRFTPIDIISPESPKSVLQDFETLKHNNILLHSETLITKDSRHVPVGITMRFYEDRGHPMAIWVIRDITELKRAQEELKRHSLELESANAELESFTYTVSHDLRSPLRAIDGFADMLLDEIGARLDPESKRKFEVISSNSKKMGQFIDDLLIFSRMGRAALSPVTINMQDDIMDVWTELQAGSRDRDIQLKIGDLPPAFGDRMLLRQVLSNLMGNAVKFTRDRAHAVIEISGSNSGKYSTYCIKDNGAGFDMRYYDKIFEIFRRLHSEEEFEGTGVGLAIVKKIVERHGGNIWAEGKPGEGATFCFTLPAGAEYEF